MKMTMRPRIVPMTETVDTSSKSVIREHNQDTLRIDLPWDMVNKVGFRWYDELRVIRDEYKLLLSVLPLHRPELYEHITPVRFVKKGGWENSKNIFREVDNAYTLIEKDFIPQFSEGDEVEFNYIQETESEERHVEVKHPNCSS